MSPYVSKGGTDFLCPIITAFNNCIQSLQKFLNFTSAKFHYCKSTSLLEVVVEMLEKCFCVLDLEWVEEKTGKKLLESPLSLELIFNLLWGSVNPPLEIALQFFPFTCFLITSYLDVQKSSKNLKFSCLCSRLPSSSPAHYPRTP